jgi:hypothetical protein
MRIGNESIIRTSGVVAMPWTSDAIYLGSIMSYSIQLQYLTSGATVKLQCSVDAGKPTDQSWTSENITNWTDISDSETTLTEDGDLLFDVSDVSYRWVRVVVTGSGYITSARFQVKGN